MSDIKIVQLAVQFGILAFIGLTFGVAMSFNKTDVAQLTVIVVYATFTLVAYKINTVWQFCQKNFKMANQSSNKRTSH